jgi:hypothetical protein
MIAALVCTTLCCTPKYTVPSRPTLTATTNSLGVRCQLSTSVQPPIKADAGTFGIELGLGVALRLFARSADMARCALLVSGLFGMLALIAG